MRSMLLVDVKDMDAQAITLLKGAVTQVTRELPVSLIDTACVFEMLVTVVLVSEHFTTSITRKAVTICGVQ